MCVFVTIEEDVPEAEGSLEDARSFLDTLICILTLVQQALAKFFRRQQASGNIVLGANAYSWWPTPHRLMRHLSSAIRSSRSPVNREGIEV
jgi:hypothetical protein